MLYKNGPRDFSAFQVSDIATAERMAVDYGVHLYILDNQIAGNQEYTDCETEDCQYYFSIQDCPTSCPKLKTKILPYKQPQIENIDYAISGLLEKCTFLFTLKRKICEFYPDRKVLGYTIIEHNYYMVISVDGYTCHLPATQSDYAKISSSSYVFLKNILRFKKPRDFVDPTTLTPAITLLETYLNQLNN